jgi:hypothetical protein
MKGYLLHRETDNWKVKWNTNDFSVFGGSWHIARKWTWSSNIIELIIN